MKFGWRITKAVAGCFVTYGLLVTAAVAQDLVRSDFHTQATSPSPGVFDDGLAGYTCTTDGVEYHFDYLDSTDSAIDCTPDPALQTGYNHSSVSGGGRWHLRLREDSPGENPRKIRIDFSAAVDDAECDRLESTFSGMGLTCGCAASCDVNVWINADALFKKNAKREGLSRFDIVEAGGADGVDGPDLRIRYYEDLYLCDAAGHEGDADWRVLKSAPCDSMDLEAGALADVIIPATGGAGQDDVIGQWLLPFHVTAQRVSPSGGEPPPPPGCTDNDADGVCVEDDDCDDANPDVYPGHNDTKGKWGRDGVDNDCNGIIDG